jgi:hypothetical protein
MGARSTDYRKRNTSLPARAKEKFCPKCRKTKGADDFPLCRCRKDGLGAYCKTCKATYDAPRNARQLGKWRNVLYSKYGLTIEDVERMRNEQKNCCAICLRSFENGRFEVDHCHASGKARELLCARCNRWLAALENSDYLAAATAYLIKHTCQVSDSLRGATPPAAWSRRASRG